MLLLVTFPNQGVQAGEPSQMTHPKNDIDVAITSREDRLDDLGRVYTKDWEEALAGLAGLAGESPIRGWLEKVQRLIQVSPVKIQSFQVILKPQEDLRPEWIAWTPRRGDGRPSTNNPLREWARKLAATDLLVKDEEGRMMITLPLPHEQTYSSKRLLRINTSSGVSLMLWRPNVLGPDIPGLTIDGRAIAAFGVTKDVPFTPIPKDRKCTDLASWPTPLEWYLDFRGLTKLGTGSLVTSQRLGVRGHDRPSWLIFAQSCLLPGPVGRSRRNPLWKTEKTDWRPNEPRTPVLEHGHFVMHHPTSPPNYRLYKIVAPLCWFGVDVTDPADVAWYLYQRLMDVPTRRLERHVKRFDDSDAIIAELHRVPA